MRNLFILAALVMGIAPAASAEAQVVIRRRGGPPATASQEPVQTQPQQASPAPARDRGPHRFGSFTIGVPLFNDANLDVVRPGANLNFRGGMDFGFFGVLFNAGTMWNPINLDNAEIPGPSLGKSPLHRFYFGIGARLQYPHERIRPYVDLSFNFNWWNFRETGVACGWWYCTNVSTYRFTPSWETRLGVQVVVKGPVSVDVGASFAFSYQGDFFQRAEYWLEPYLGIASRF